MAHYRKGNFNSHLHVDTHAFIIDFVQIEIIDVMSYVIFCHFVSFSFFANHLLLVFFITEHKEKKLTRVRKIISQKIIFNEDRFKNIWKQFFLQYKFVWKNLFLGQLSAQNLFKTRNKFYLMITFLWTETNFL